jgi:hypothetical protein
MNGQRTVTQGQQYRLSFQAGQRPVLLVQRVSQHRTITGITLQQE